MMKPSALVAPASETAPLAAPVQRSYRAFGVAACALLAVYALPLLKLFRFSIGSQLYSHIVLIPLVSAYFVWLKRAELPAPSKSDRPVAFSALLLSAVFIGVYIALWDVRLRPVDRHALGAFGFVFGLVGTIAATLGRPFLRSVIFPLGFLVFLSPLPSVVVGWVETFLQHGSAAVAYALFKISGTPVYNDNLLFILPGFSMQVAPQCSGIHSTLALFITSVAAGYMFLRRHSLRIVLAAAVIPLALLRNGLRVFVIGELCVRISPEMINSWVHKQGGPFFFALSLIPFSALLFVLYRRDRRAVKLPSAS